MKLVWKLQILVNMAEFVKRLNLCSLPARKYIVHDMIC